MASILNDNQTTPMSETNTHSNSPPPRVLRIWLPSRKVSWYMLVVLAVGVLVSYAMAVAMLAVAIVMPFEMLDRTPPGFLVPVAWLLAMIGPYPWIRIFNRWQHRRRIKPTRHRCARLAKVLEAKESIVRLPHRYIEQLMRKKSASTKPMKRALLALNPGTVIIANGSRLHDLPRLTPNDISFEPIDLIEDEGQAIWLVRANYEAQNLAHEEYMSTEEETEEGSPGHLYWQAQFWTDRFMGVAILLMFAAGPLLFDNDPIIKWLLISSLTLLAFAALFGELFTERRWWLMPCGLFYREHRFWKKELRIKLLRATDTPLFLNLELGQALVVDDGKVRSISISPSMGLAILAGWISTAHTPTEQEIQSFVGITDEPRLEQDKP